MKVKNFRNSGATAVIVGVAGSAGAAAVTAVSPAVKAAAGCLGGGLEALCLQPMDTVKTRLQLDRVGKYRGIANCGATIVRQEGVEALWKGVVPFTTHLMCKYAMRMGTNAVYQGALRDEHGQLSGARRMAAGFCAGMTEALVIVTPFEVVKIRLQQQQGAKGAQVKYRGTLGTFSTIAREEGLRGLWSGATPTVMRNGTNQACLFWAKNNMDKVLWRKHEGDGRVLLPWQSMISGFSAACLGPLVTNPFDVAKTRLMAQGGAAADVPKYRGFFDCIFQVARSEGPTALYKGLLPRLMRIPPGQAIVWGVADQVIGYFEAQKA